MGSVYDNIDSIVKSTVLGTSTSSLFGAARKKYSTYSASIKRSLGWLRIPVIAAVTVGALQHPLSALSWLLVYGGYASWNTELSKRGHLWTAQQLKKVLYKDVKATALWMGIAAGAYFMRYSGMR